MSLLLIFKVWKWYKTLSYTIRLSVTTKEYKEVPLAQWKVALTPQNIYTSPELRCLEERQREASFFLHWIISQLINVEPIERCYIMMYDANIEEAHR